MEQVSCLYSAVNLISVSETDRLLDLDPLIDADPNFDTNDVFAGVMNRVTQDNRVLGLPITLQPLVLQYNPSRFEEMGIPEPTQDWTIDQFVDALQQLKPTPDDDTPMQQTDFGSSYLQMLMASFGGVPIDYETNPPTVHFVDNIDAIQQVLDLAKDEYIPYTELFGFGGGGGGFGGREHRHHQHPHESFWISGFFRRGRNCAMSPIHAARTQPLCPMVWAWVSSPSTNLILKHAIAT